MQRAPTYWVIDPDDPRAPPQELWDRMTPEERQRVLDTLPSEFEVSEASPPEGDFHFNPKMAARDALGGFFERIGRRVYLACELPVYYPAERMFAPDLIAVLDVEVKERAHWSVSAEGKGVDLALEILWSGRTKKDLEDNVTRHASLGISEYFVFDRRRRRLRGYRLAQDGARYLPIVPQEGRLTSAVLDLDLALEEDRLRFFHGQTAVLETRELLARLGTMMGDLEARIERTELRLNEERQRADEERRRVDEAERRADEERRRVDEAERRADEERRRVDEAERRADEERRRLDRERQRADEAERRLAEALAELARLKRERG
ncbi:Uma2 family endonuclease [Sorangium sp. So ce1036]|uniref:Uma2 family endonuclease n=1 Tax=Sorangium sp. So ce1036 TaxID=3133328 RepID=UPI003F03202B